MLPSLVPERTLARKQMPGTWIDIPFSFRSLVWDVDHGVYRFSGTLSANQRPEMTLNLTEPSPFEQGIGEVVAFA